MVVLFRAGGHPPESPLAQKLQQMLIGGLVRAGEGVQMHAAGELGQGAAPSMRFMN